MSGKHVDFVALKFECLFICLLSAFPTVSRSFEMSLAAAVASRRVRNWLIIHNKQDMCKVLRLNIADRPEWETVLSLVLVPPASESAEGRCRSLRQQFREGSFEDNGSNMRSCYDLMKTVIASERNNSTSLH
jgi:hypothetical protein